MRRSASLAFFSVASLLALSAFGPGCGDDGGQSTSSMATSGGGEGGEGEGGAGQGGASSTSTSGAGAGTPLVVVHWNVRNLFDTEKNSASDDEMVYSPSEYDEKMDAVAAVLRDLDPDVAVLQEVENQGVLQDLAARVGSAFVEARLVEGNDFRGIDVGALSKVPFDAVVSHADETFNLPGGAPKTFTRDCPEFHLTHAGRRIALLGVHFRSKGGDDDPDRRLAEAFRSRQIADELAAGDPELGVVILGDYNDLPGSDPVELIRTGPPAFIDAVDFVPEADRWTFDFQGGLELIDHQMANPVAAPWIDPASVTIRHGAEVEAASDHSPVSATYMVR
jgi:predicted extracellular nuclease